MTNEQAEIQQAAREFWDAWLNSKSPKRTIPQLMADFHISRSEEERKMAESLSKMVIFNAERADEFEAENVRLRGALELAVSQGCNCWNSGEQGHAHGCFIPKAEAALSSPPASVETRHLGSGEAKG